MEQISKFDIFSGSIDKDALWLETAEGLANAKQRMNEIAAKSPGKYFVFCDFSHTVVALTDTAPESPFQPGKTSPTKTRVKEAHMVVKQTAVSTKLSPENFAFLDKQRRSFRPYDISMSSLVNLCVRIVRQLHARGELSLEPLQLQAQLNVDLGKFIESKQRERVTGKIAKHPKHVSSRGPTSSPMTKKRQRVQRFAEVADMDQQKCAILRPAAVAQEKIAV